MCGIIGGFFTKVSADFDRRLRQGVSALSRRGPDDRGQEFLSISGGTLALGHTRLSIIDLTAAGHQPMRSADGRFTIVYNGEVYNYRELRGELASLGYVFRSETDTEVLLACWAQWAHACLPRLRGMFAFVVFDHVEQELTCVRDAFGIKPFFYHIDESCFLFASELPALLALMPCAPVLNPQRAYDYLLFGGYDDKETTFYAGIRHLMPGHWLTIRIIDGIRLKGERWWWPSIKVQHDLSFRDSAAQLRAMFLGNVRSHLRSDVAVGAALSGGVDSSAVVCAMRYIEPEMPIHTFTYVARGSSVDEEFWADLVSTRVGAIPHKVTCSARDLAVDLDDMIRAQGEPFGSTSIYAQYRVFRLAREEGIIVTLDGQGADELLAGYSGYPGARMRSLWERRELASLLVFLSRWPRWPGRSFKQIAISFGAMIAPELARTLAYRFTKRMPAVRWLNRPQLVDVGVAMEWKMPGLLKGGEGRRLMETLRGSLTGQGLGALLRHGDRNSMRWSVESRVPFLTTDLAEFLLGLPEDYLISQEGETKRIFRAAMRGIVPDVILDRRDKVGFQTPEQSWLLELGPEAMEWLDGIEAIPFLHAGRCRAEMKSIINGDQPFTSHVWRMMNFCRWVQTAGVVV